MATIAKRGRPRKKRTATATTTASKKFSGKVYAHSGCHSTEAAAKTAAKNARSAGKLARVVGKCVYSRSAR